MSLPKHSRFFKQYYELAPEDQKRSGALVYKNWELAVENDIVWLNDLRDGGGIPNKKAIEWYDRMTGNNLLPRHLSDL